MAPKRAGDIMRDVRQLSLQEVRTLAGSASATAAGQQAAAWASGSNARPTVQVSVLDGAQPPSGATIGSLEVMLIRDLRKDCHHIGKLFKLVVEGVSVAHGTLIATRDTTGAQVKI